MFRRWQTLYAFLVIGLAVFLITLACWRPPVVGHVGEVHVDVRSVARTTAPDDLHAALDATDGPVRPAVEREDGQPRTQGAALPTHGLALLLADLDAQLHDVEFLRSALVGPANSAALSQQQREQLTDQQLLALADTLHFEQHSTNGRDACQVRLRVSQGDPQRALMVVGRLAEALVTRVQGLATQHLATPAAAAPSGAPQIGIPGDSEANANPSTTVAENQRVAANQLEQAQQLLDQFLDKELSKRRQQWQADCDARVAAVAPPRHPATETMPDTTPPTLVANDPVAPQELPSPSAADSAQSVARETNVEMAAQANPDYTRLAKTIQLAQQERAELLKRMTPIHPEILLVDRKIEEMQQRLAEMPPTLPGVDGRLGDEDANQEMLVDGSESTPVATGDSLGRPEASGEASSEGPTDTAELDAPVDPAPFDTEAAMAEIRASDRYRELLSAVDAAQRVLETQPPASQETDAQSPDHLAAPYSASIIGLPRIVQRVRRPLDKRHLSAIGLWATVAAFAVSILPGKRAPLTVFTEPAELEARLALPVVGTLPTPDGPPQPAVAPRQLAATTRRLVRVGEWLVIALVFTIGAMAIVDRGIGSQIFADPLQAFLLSVDGIRDWFFTFWPTR